MTPTKDALTRFVDRHRAVNPVLLEPFDPQWTSPCELGDAFAGLDGEPTIRWAPQPRFHADADFLGLEQALETTIHPDLKTYYGSYWSGNLEAQVDDGHVSLLQLWNSDDVLRLVENQIGHTLNQKRAKGPLSFFFACTEPESDLILTLENATGAVLLERPGHKPLRTVAANLAEFLDSLAPIAEQSYVDHQTTRES